MKRFSIYLSALLLLGSCKKETVTNFFFSPDDDIKLGWETVKQIESNPAEYPVMDSASNPVAYGHINRITQTILNSGKVEYKDKFVWRVRLIKDDNTLNAFCTPGGFIYVYSGIIKYLDNEAQLAGVMGHEIAHADRRHGANQMVKLYGISALLAIIGGGDQNQLATLAANLILLKYGRDDENDADQYSVIYLYPTEYDPRGAKYFFEKLQASGQGGGTPTFLSTHPDPGDRVNSITQHWTSMGGRTDGQTFESRYGQFKASLP